jgi:heme/copper-type cytochrome/quinol oxidase subunit 1
MFGHPEVYFLVVPVFGILLCAEKQLTSSGLRTRPLALQKGDARFARVVLFIILGSFTVWGHHLLTSHLSRRAVWVFLLCSLTIAALMGRAWLEWVRFLRPVRVYRESLFLGGMPHRAAVWYWNCVVGVLSFLFGGILGLSFLRADVSAAVHGTMYVVGHFHFFAVGFVLAMFNLAVLRLCARFRYGRLFLRRPQSTRRYLVLLVVL